MKSRPRTDQKLDKDDAVHMYQIMTLMPIVDNVLYNSQRQGRISFYMQCTGEEAAIVGSSAAMLPNDEMFGQYVRNSCRSMR